MAFIISLIENTIQEVLEREMAQYVDYGGSESVTLGRLMDDPEGVDNPIEIYENDPDDPDGWVHQQCTAVPGTPGLFPTFEIGGGESWVRRFTVKFNVFLTREGLERDAAKEVINLVHGRIMHALRDATELQGLQDDYGETVWQSRHCVAKSEVTLGGGPPTSWIGRGKLWVQVFTSM